MKLPAFIAGLMLGPATLDAAVTDGLVAHYTFDETSGTTAADSIRGVAGSGILTDFGPSPWVEGKIGGAIETDGVNDWITSVDSIANDATSMSFSGWVWADTRPAWASIAKNWGGSQSGQFHLGLNASDGRLSNYLTNGTNVIDSVQFPTGSWQHVAVTYDGATHRLYRNGVGVGSLTTTTTLVRNSDIVSFGVKTNNEGTAPDTGNAGWWDGRFDDFGFWDRALTEAEVVEIYNAGLQGLSIGQATGPVITSFTANPPNIPAGGTTTLSWTVQNAATLTLNGGPFSNQDVTGQTAIATPALAADTTFTLTASNPQGTTNAQRLVGVGPAVQEPVISEFLAANDTGLRDAAVAGDREDWIEIHNPNLLYSFDIGGYHLTDEPDNLDKWTIPSVILPPGGYLTIFASEKNRTVAGGPLHTNFKLLEDGEYLALVKPDGATVVHEFAPTYPNQTSDVSYSAAGFLATPTPGAANSALAGPAINAMTENPPPPMDADDLTVSARLTPQGDSTVTAATLVYRVMFGAEVSVPMTADDAGVFSATIPASASSPAQMIRWRVTAADSAGRTSRAPLFRDPTNSPQYFGTVVQDATIVTQLPVIHRFVQNTSGIDRDPGTRCSICFDGEFFDNVGIRLRGLTSRSWPKKSHKIEMNSGHRFRFKTGVPRVTEFDLNTTYTDKSYVRAMLTSELQLAGGMASPEIRPVHIRQNAAFYSVALFTENPDTEYLQRHGIDPDGAYYKAPSNNTYSTSSTFEKKSRLYEAGRADLNGLISNLGLTGTNRETFVFDHVDLPGMVNYIATTCVSQNIDASDKNHFAYRDTNGSGEWVMLPWDLDLTFGPNALNTDTIVYNQNYASHPFIGATPYLLHAGKNNRFLEAVINTPRCRNMIIRRIRSLIDQFLATGWFQSRIDELVPVLDPDVTLDHAKWGSSSHFGGVTHSLLAATNRIKSEYLAPRLTWLNGGGSVGIPSSQPAAPPINFGAFDFNPASGNQDQEFIELVNPNAFSVDLSGWTVSGGITHTIRPATVILPGESLYLTPSSAAFRARAAGPGGNQRLFVQGGVRGHLSNFGETLTLKNDHGTPIATLSIPPAPSDPQRFLVVTEVMYHPEPDGDAEFVELMNINPSVTLDLGGVRFSAGIDFAFSPGTTLAPMSRILVVRNIAAFEGLHGTDRPVAGEFTSPTSLSNGGERLKLDDATGSTIRDFIYDDLPPWPPGSDGGGSLVLIAPLTNPDHSLPRNWRVSTTANGNPGSEDAVHFTGNPEADDDLDGWTNLIEYALGPSPQVMHAQTLDGPTFAIPHVSNADDAEVIGEVSTALAGWTPADFVADTGGTLSFRIPVPLRAEKQLFFRALVRLR